MHFADASANRTFTAVSDRSGRYAIQVPPGSYMVIAGYADLSPGDAVKSRTPDLAADGRVDVDAVGYQAVVRSAEREEPAAVLNAVIETVRATGALGIPGLYVPSDPGGVDDQARAGTLRVAFGRLFEKGLRLGTGQCNVKRYNRQLRDMIIAGRARPSFVVSHELPLDSAPSAYEKFDKRIEGYTKVILHP